MISHQQKWRHIVEFVTICHFLTSLIPFHYLSQIIRRHWLGQLPKYRTRRRLSRSGLVVGISPRVYSGCRDFSWELAYGSESFNDEAFRYFGWLLPDGHRAALFLRLPDITGLWCRQQWVGASYEINIFRWHFSQHYRRRFINYLFRVNLWKNARGRADFRQPSPVPDAADAAGLHAWLKSRQ